jgi:hypothetical protein
MPQVQILADPVVPVRFAAIPAATWACPG